MTRAEIENEFRDIEGIDEAKKIYKDLAKKLHPDVGGTTEEFKVLNDVYNYILENGIDISEDSEFDLELVQKTEQIGHQCCFYSDTSAVLNRTVMLEMIRTL